MVRKNALFKRGIRFKKVKIPKGYGVSSVARTRKTIDITYIKRKFPKKQKRSKK